MKMGILNVDGEKILSHAHPNVQKLLMIIEIFVKTNGDIDTLMLVILKLAVASQEIHQSL